MAQIIKNINRMIYACDIPYQVCLPQSTIFPHQALGVVIHPGAIIGEQCIICQNVTIGQLADGKRMESGQYREKHEGRAHAPELKNGVMVGVGACILGGIVIGENAVIAANSVVLDDVPDNTVVAGVPAKIKKQL